MPTIFNLNGNTIMGRSLTLTRGDIGAANAILKGNVHIHEVDVNGTVGTRVYSKKWTSGWTQAKPFVAGSQQYLFLLKKIGISSFDGKNVHVHKINNDGKQVKVAAYKWTSGWTTVEFYQVGGSTYLFLLKKSGTGSDGKNVHVHRMNLNGTVGTRVYSKKWTSGWTQAKPFVAGSQQYLFLLKEGNGIVHIRKINNNGKVGNKIAAYNWSSGWTSCEFYSISGTLFLFLLKAHKKYA